MADSHVSPRNSRAAIVTPNAYLLFYRRRSEVPLGGPLLAEVVTSTHSQEARSDSVSGSREPSPSAPGEGPLGGSSLNGSSSTFRSTEAGATRHMGGGGPAAAAQQRQGVSQGAGGRMLTGARTPQLEDEDDELPEYTEIAPDEGIDMHDGDVQMFGPNLENPSWSFTNLGSIGAPHSQMTAVPPSSLDGEVNDFFTQEEDLFAADDNASTKAEGGDGSSVGMSDRGDEFVDAPTLESTVADQRGTRESAPPPGLDDDAGDLPVAETQVDDAEDESR
jgi:ubiquitin carboxyl-terminal hydrolase 4/11